MSSYAPPFARMRNARHIPHRGTQAAPPAHEKYSLEELEWDENMKKADLIEAARKRGISLPAKITRKTLTRKDLIRLLEEYDEAQPKDVMAALQARETGE